MGFAKPWSPHTRLPFPDTPVPLRCPWSHVPLPARPSPALRAEGPAAGPTLTFFPVRLGSNESPEEKEPEGELHAGAAGAQPQAGRGGGPAGSPGRLRPLCPGGCGQRMGLSRGSQRGAHVAQAWPAEVMKDQGEWVEKPYCLYLF